MENVLNKQGSFTMATSFKNCLSLVKFSHTIFVIPFAVTGFFYGLHIFNYTLHRPWWITFILVILCMVFARSAAMAFNRYLDAGFDSKNARTIIREIPAGILSKRTALLFVIFNSLAFMITTYFINALCMVLAPVALFIILFYSYTKRFTPLRHLLLGLGLSFVPMGAFIAVTGHFALVPVLFSLAVLFWVGGFDIIYALQDEEFENEFQLHSMPSWLGPRKALRVSEFLYFLSAITVVIAGFAGKFSWLYGSGVLTFLFFLIYQHLLVKPRDLTKAKKAFRANGISSVVFNIFVLLDIFSL